MAGKPPEEALAVEPKTVAGLVAILVVVAGSWFIVAIVGCCWLV